MFVLNGDKRILLRTLVVTRWLQEAGTKNGICQENKKEDRTSSIPPTSLIPDCSLLFPGVGSGSIIIHDVEPISYICAHSTERYHGKRNCCDGVFGRP